MTKCKAIKKDGEKCTFKAKEGSRYCGRHQNYRASDSDKTHKELIEKIKKIVTNPIVLFILTVFLSFYIFSEEVKHSIKLSEESLNETYWLTSPVILQVNHTVKYLNNSEGILEINVTNTHPSRKTGAIYIYRLEINPNKPHRIIDGLEPGQSLTYNLSFKTKKEVIKPVTDMYYDGYTVYFHENSSEMSKILYAYEHISISYKISCDNCPSQGVIRRVPDFGKADYFVGIKNIGGTLIKSDEIPIYEWEDYKLGEVLQNESIMYLLNPNFNRKS